MGRVRGAKERKSALKAAAVRKNAKRPRPKRSMTNAAAAQVATEPDVKAQVKETINRLRTAHWPTCEELVRQVLEDDLRDGSGKPLTEPIYLNGSIALDRRGRVRRVRVHVTSAQRLMVAQDLWDRTGFTRQTTTRLEGGDGLPELVFRRMGFSKPSALQEPGPEAKSNGHEGNGAEHPGGGESEIPPPAVH